MVGAHDDTVDGDLRTGRQLDDVAGDDVRRRDLLRLVVAPYRHLGRVDDTELLQRVTGAQLLRDADDAVDDDGEPEQRVAQRARRDDEGHEDREDRVDACEQVRSNDLPRRAHAVVRGVVDLPTTRQFLHLGRAQARLVLFPLSHRPIVS